LTETWRLLRHYDAEPGFNMAVDEALLECSDAPVTLRFYTWEPAALSLGYFQRFRDVPAASDARAVVRRLTGGGAIHHADELTFSITAPADHALYRGEVKASYERVHARIARALAELEIDADLRRERSASSDRAGTGMCFHHSTDLDLLWDGAKGVGSAQRRTGGRVLHHGSIKLGATALEPGVSTVRSHAPAISPEAFAARLADAFGDGERVRLEPGELTPGEREAATRRADHFRSAEFIRRR
jgi:lipoate-protein ligase A